MSKPTCDICDDNEAALTDGSLRVIPPLFQSWGLSQDFSGLIETVRCFEDNGMVRSVLETAGNGRVLVVDGGGSDRCALVGGNLATLGQDNGWAGIIVYGCIRDINEIEDCDIGVYALASHPRRSAKHGNGEQNVVVDIAGVRIEPGEWCSADADGIVISGVPLA